MGSMNRVSLRWPDFDGLGHVSHTAILVLLEAGRDAALSDHGIRGEDYVVAHCEVGYTKEIGVGANWVDVECVVSALGRTSITTAERIIDEAGATVVEAKFTLVLWDSSRHASRPLSEQERASLGRMTKLKERA
jgi:acyl-CoA thioesterase FadM